MESKIHTSSSGKYTLEVSSKETKPGCWNYTTGVVKLRDHVLAEVDRNYSSFPFLFIEGHRTSPHRFDEHDYLVCGSDYQGQTVIDLCCSEREDFLPESAKKGHGFCWAAYEFDSKSQILVVDGCHWACPYEFRFYDFSDPMDFQELKIGGDGYLWAQPKLPVFMDDGTIVYSEYREDDLDDDDEDEDEDDDEDEDESPGPIVATRTFKRNGNKLELVDSWVDEEEQVRRDESERRRKAYEAAWKKYKATDPLYLRVLERVEAEFEGAWDHVAIGQCYEGWCPHFDEKDGRVTRRLANKQTVGKDTISLDLEWGKKKAPVKLVVYKNGDNLEDKWFDHSLEGIDAALDYALDKLLPPPGLLDRLLDRTLTH